ncbi:WD40 repeat-like protein [Dendrothele bispora CBS 962.96]|uniref:WD40 repeat-like protein n=1 Tax=Dendrothele bispora (strain CBS 962.96) TaxID=1314807 RepID=A0A4S8M372_DENBC|nr:WD40 repeat-like protein [Dendrothele bispora CBS 962.96]
MFQRFFGNSYKKVATLTGPRNAIQSVSLSVDGIFASASGYGGVTIWDLRTSEIFSTPHLPYEPNDPKHVYCSSAWLFFEGIDKHVFIVGNMAGELSMWSLESGKKVQVVDNQDPSNHQVMSIDVSDLRVAPGHHGRIVTSTSNRLIAVWTLSSAMEITNIFKVNLSADFLPRTVKFAQGTDNVFAFSKMGRSFLQLHGQTGDFSWIKKDGPQEMHCVSVDERNDLFAAWTGQRAEIFKLSNSEQVRAFQGEVALVGNTKQVAFAEEGSKLVVGSDHGFAEVFVVQSGECIQRLHYPRKALVQYVGIRTLPSSHIIAIAGSTKGQASDVVVYKKKRRLPSLHNAPDLNTDDNLIFNLNFPVTWTAVRWCGYIAIFFMMTYFMVRGLFVL